MSVQVHDAEEPEAGMLALEEPIGDDLAGGDTRLTKVAHAVTTPHLK